MKRCYIAQVDEKIGTKAYPQILEQLKENGESIKPLLVIFASDNANFGWYSRMLSNSFPEATVIGATTDVMYSPFGVTRSGLSVMAITEGISVSSGVVFEVSRHPRRSADAIAEAYRQVEAGNTVCLEFNASADNCEELLMDTYRQVIGDTGVPICGCSASFATNPDRQSAVSLNGILYMDASVFAFVHNERGRINRFQENMVAPSNHFFTATDVDCDERKVYEFDHKSAAGVYARALKIPEDELSANSFYHPLGRIENGDLGIIGFREQYSDGSLSFFSKIYNQTRVVLLDPIDPPETVWAETAAKVHEAIGEVSFSLIINCIQRIRYFTQTGKLMDYNETLKADYGTYIGLSGHGEQYAYKHLNQTMLILSFE